jgi:hypothetical protein
MITHEGGAKMGMKSRMSAEKKITGYHIAPTFAQFAGKRHCEGLEGAGGSYYCRFHA